MNSRRYLVYLKNWTLHLIWILAGIWFTLSTGPYSLGPLMVYPKVLNLQASLPVSSSQAN